MLKLSEKYGPLMSLKFGNVPTVVASSPETVKDVLKTFDADCCSRPYLTYAARISYNLNDLAFSPYSKYWREVRRMTVLELYTAKRVQSFRHIREEEVASLVEFVKGAALLGNTVNLSNTLMKLSGSVICRVGFGINLKGSKLEDTYEEIIRETMEVLGSFAAADYLPIIGRIIDRVTGLHSKYDIIALLLKMERGEAGLGEYQLTRNHTKGILLNVLIAGIDTSGHTITWAMTHDQKPKSFEESASRETVRINPLVPLLIPREASKDIKIAGYDIPKKTWIHVNIWGVHRNPNVWNDPETFIPESGRRMCPGMGMCMALAHLTLINLLYRFDWKLPVGMEIEDVDLEESYGLVCPKKVLLQLVPIPVASLELLLTSDLHVETDEGEKAKSVKRASVSDGETKANCFQRIWSEEDEIALLQGIVDYKETSGLDPFNGERKALYDLLKPHISVSVTSVQFFQKIRTLKKKFKKEKNKGSKPNNQKLFHLSKVIWGDEEISSAEKDELKTGEGKEEECVSVVEWRH
ncbi:hypothetical protein IGI04_001454 [Brassica rapa subsp. trilocularis]|uniref:Glabrous enhancer-binding protein-like DBD domain-containing protein n=1 Tax=Brassica rapa subsp. trilocularis TaxID=1813537 RepID=A0ABQ7NST6_BRACM|nr:hypothetical protein IGI04_001454 [Brassica rapa subsp. trilocularis]